RWRRHETSVMLLQRWVSLIAGAALLLGLMISFRQAGASQMFRAVAILKRAFTALIKERTLASQFLLGGINGLLPCGLVYAEVVAASATGGFWTGMVYMALFGLGTLPMMLGLGMAGARLQAALALRFRRLLPITLAV